MYKSIQVFEDNLTDRRKTVKAKNNYKASRQFEIQNLFHPHEILNIPHTFCHYSLPFCLIHTAPS